MTDRKALLAAIAMLATALPVAPAISGEARASANLPVFDRPGERGRLVGKLQKGASYEVLECTRRSVWCLVGDDVAELGWVEGSYLVGSGAKAAVTPPEFINPFGRHRPRWE